ncbi:MAG: hypothetical protein QXX59_08790 [Candidatus Bathyarchaeia archaeon]
MSVKVFAGILLMCGVLLLIEAINLYVATSGFPNWPETKVLFPQQIVQIKSDTIEGYLRIPFNVTIEGHVYADVGVPPWGYAFTFYAPYFETSDGQRVNSWIFKPGTYYLVVPFKLDQGLSLPYEAWVGIYEEIKVPHPLLQYGITCFISGAGCLLAFIYIAVKHKEKC